LSSSSPLSIFASPPAGLTAAALLVLDLAALVSDALASEPLLGRAAESFLPMPVHGGDKPPLLYQLEFVEAAVMWPNFFSAISPAYTCLSAAAALAFVGESIYLFAFLLFAHHVGFVIIFLLGLHRQFEILFQKQCVTRNAMCVVLMIKGLLIVTLERQRVTRNATVPFYSGLG
jgi:hypothetical protein